MLWKNFREIALDPNEQYVVLEYRFQSGVYHDCEANTESMRPVDC